jgi:hypothetical protein
VNEMLRNRGATPKRFANPRALMIGAKSSLPPLTILCCLRLAS